LQERLGIAGAGVIACGLAAAAAARDGDVMLWARSDRSADRAQASVARICAKANPDAAHADRIRVVTDLSSLSEATFLVEAVVEHYGSKAALLTELAEMTTFSGGDGVLATTTSSLSIAALAEATGRPERFLGLHVFNPVPRMQLIELVFPDAATEATRQRARQLCEDLGKVAVEVPDIPGFVVNRLLFPYLFGAVELQAETGMAAEDIDRCMTLGAGLPMGPLALLDLVGLDVSASIGEAIGATVPAALRRLVEDGALGRKAGRGFYSYD
jgi:3-hydroxybutyryl-CoA dehydrogenase